MTVKDVLVSISKEEISLLLESLSSENVAETIKEIDKHLGLLRQMDDITYRTDLPKSLTIVPPAKKKLTNDPKISSPPPKPKPLYKEETGKNNQWVRGQFKRLLKGGNVGTNQHIYVPEKVIRELELKENDWVQANFISRSNRKNKYEFMLLARTQEPLPSDYTRRESTCLPVFKHPDLARFYIKFGNKNEQTTQVLLSTIDVANFKIDETSIIDYAYPQGQRSNGRVTWKHSNYNHLKKEEPEKVTTGKKTKPHPKKSPAKTRQVQPIFLNRTISMIGGKRSSVQPAIKREVERRGGKFILCLGDEPATTIRSRIKRSDAVVVFTDNISHDAMHLAKDVCKEFTIPVSYTKNLGSERFIARVSSLLKKI